MSKFALLHLANFSIHFNVIRKLWNLGNIKVKNLPITSQKKSQQTWGLQRQFWSGRAKKSGLRVHGSVVYHAFAQYHIYSGALKKLTQAKKGGALRSPTGASPSKVPETYYLGVKILSGKKQKWQVSKNYYAVITSLLWLTPFLKVNIWYFLFLSLRLHLRNSKQLLHESTEFSIKLCLSIYVGYSVAASAVAVLLACPCGLLCVSTKG